MVWEGFAIFQCPLKEESEHALKELADSSHQLMMITGDAPLTACFAASKVHIVTREVLVLSHREEDTGHVHGLAKVRAAEGGCGLGAVSWLALLELAEGLPVTLTPATRPSSFSPTQSGPKILHDSEYQWVSPDELTVLPFVRSFTDVLRIASRYDLAVSGDALSYLETVGLAAEVIPLCQVGRGQGREHAWPHVISPWNGIGFRCPPYPPQPVPPPPAAGVCARVP